MNVYYVWILEEGRESAQKIENVSIKAAVKEFAYDNIEDGMETVCVQDDIGIRRFQVTTQWIFHIDMKEML